MDDTYVEHCWIDAVVCGLWRWLGSNNRRLLALHNCQGMVRMETVLALHGGHTGTVAESLLAA
jgi:hypothetical protein